MDLFDVLAWVPLPGERGLHRRARNEQIATFVAILGLPTVDAAITAVRGLKDPLLLCVILPAVFAVLAYFTSRLLRARIGYSTGSASDARSCASAGASPRSS
jgi:hypothetical protein